MLSFPPNLSQLVADHASPVKSRLESESVKFTVRHVFSNSDTKFFWCFCQQWMIKPCQLLEPESPIRTQGSCLQLAWPSAGITVHHLPWVWLFVSQVAVIMASSSWRNLNKPVVTLVWRRQWTTILCLSGIVCVFLLVYILLSKFDCLSSLLHYVIWWQFTWTHVWRYKTAVMQLEFYDTYGDVRCFFPCQSAYSLCNTAMRQCEKDLMCHNKLASLTLEE